MIDEKLTDRRAQRTIKPNHVPGKLNLTGRMTAPSRALNKPLCPLPLPTCNPPLSNSCPAAAVAADHDDEDDADDDDEHDRRMSGVERSVSYALTISV